METIFRAGMKVYDEIFHKGETLTVKGNPSFGEVIVLDSTGTEDRYSSGGVKLVQDESYDWNKLDMQPTLSTKPYVLDGFEQKDPTPDFEKMWKKPEKSYRPQIEYCSSYHTQDLANAFEALRRLLFIMEYYNEGWQADWNNNKQIKYTIENYQNRLWCDNYTTAKKLLNFKTPEIRDQFLEEQRYLLEFVKPLI